MTTPPKDARQQLLKSPGVCGGGHSDESLVVITTNAARLVTLLTVVVVCGCATSSKQRYHVEEEQRIREAVLLEHLTSRATNRVVFVSFLESTGKFIDPSDDFIVRIRSTGIPARKASESATDNQTRVIDKTRGDLGVIYYAGVRRWYGNSKVEVITGSICASLGGGCWEFFMERQNGKWVRTKTKKMMTM